MGILLYVTVLEEKKKVGEGERSYNMNLWVKKKYIYYKAFCIWGAEGHWSWLIFILIDSISGSLFKFRLW